MRGLISSGLYGFTSAPGALLSRLARALRRPFSFGSAGESKLSEEKIALLVLIIVAGFSTAVVYHYVMGYYFGKPWPANTFLHLPAERFGDFEWIVASSAGLDPFTPPIGGFEGSPFGQFVGYLFSVIHPALAQLAVFFVSFFAAFGLMVKHCLYGLRSKLAPRQLLAIFAIVFLTYPVIFAVDRGNFELLVVPCLFLFAFAYEQQKYRASTIFLALAIAIKLWPVVLIMVYVFNKRYKETALVLLTVLFLSALSLTLFKDGLFVEAQKYLDALLKMNGDLSAGNQQWYTSTMYCMLTIVIKSVGDVLNIDPTGTTMYLPAHPGARIGYAVVAVAVFTYLVIYLWKEPRPLWKTMAVLTIMIILLPYNSHDYRLMYLFVPMLTYMAINVKTPHDLPIVVLYGLLLVPKNYYHIDAWQNIGMIINPLLLIGLLICIVPDAFSWRGVTSSFRFVHETLRSLWHREPLESARSS